MKNQMLSISILIITAIAIISCGKKSDTDKDMQNKTQYYNTIDEASGKAKSDFQEILKVSKDLNIKVDSKELEQSAPQGTVKHYLVNINKLISGDSLKDLAAISNDENISIVPFVFQNKIIATASLTKDKAGWTVTGMFNNKITSDLNIVKRNQKEGTKLEVRYFEVPNIDAHVYEITIDNSARYFTDYNNMFSLEKGTSLMELLRILRQDAAEFQKKFGEELKKNELVK